MNINMSTATKKNILERVYSFFSRRIVYHTVLWVGYILSFTLIQNYGNQRFFFWLTNQLILAFFYAAGVYFNMLYLIPNYLTEKKYGTYSV